MLHLNIDGRWCLTDYITMLLVLGTMVIHINSSTVAGVPIHISSSDVRGHHQFHLEDVQPYAGATQLIICIWKMFSGWGTYSYL